MFALLIVILATAPAVPPPLVAVETPALRAKQAGVNLISMGYGLGALGQTTAFLGGLWSIMLAITPRSCGIDPCARLGTDSTAWAMLGISIGAVLLLAIPMVIEGFRERISAALDLEAGQVQTSVPR